MAVMKANLESLNIGDIFLTKYEIRGLIGRGGQATVYHSYDTYMDRHVAIKVMTDAFDSKREHSRRAQMEARVLCKFHHPNIVHVYDAGTTDNGAIYIIMELLKGRTLRDVLREHRKLSVHEALSIGAQIADGVEVAHRQQVIHRDLKPENIFIVDGNVVKVLDFGIAKFLTLTGITTQRDTLQGTMWYISPEHVQGFGVTPRSDIYALGSILYEAISGTPPCLVGLQEISTQSVAWSQISRIPPQLDEVMTEVPSHVGRLIQRMLVKDATERQESMTEVAEALRAACERLNEEANRPPMQLRDLWQDTQVRPVTPGTASAEPNPADTSKDSRTPNVMQPTIEVREPAPRDAVSSNPNIGAAAMVSESGIIVPKVASATEPPNVPAPPGTDDVQSGGETILAQASSAVDADADVNAGLPARSIMLNRRLLLTVAVVLGTVAGIVLGLSGHLSSNKGQPPGSASAPAGEVADIAQVHQSSPPVSNSPSVSAPTTPDIAGPAVATSALSAMTARSSTSSATSASQNTNGRISNIRPSPSVVPPPEDRAGRKRTSGTGPKPRYTGDDLE